MTRVAILGAGVMGGAVLSALLRSGRPPADIVLSDRMVEPTRELAQQHGVVSAPAAEAAQHADIVVLAVKPQDMPDLLATIHASIGTETLVISVAAGISTEYLENRLPANTGVVRVMPNTPAQVDQGMSILSAGRHCTPKHLAQAEELLATFGRVLILDEKHQHAATAISGSGPAYIFYVTEAMIEAGVLLGLPRQTATEMVVQTLYGAATMIRETGEHPSILREQVSSPGGTSVAALRQLEDHKVRAAFLTAIEAAARRSQELSEGD
ncbi:pyrroline-5-carboxylate reductase [Ornithinimicrobium ciconiae]|uniref:Pyrroline-5-carboxylate reductase n=1 Tax=Ornithinimicrobium ciconiae TaxID=2594265 RepID=A0A516GEA2_9MICO|nr:pyrroline-5-carboxylate reductase [Ornithinimicrobium ciconiae]QDO89867.1 pyrroline-5-carboxylate reductase [Ornithinimicrobium ciconiae]